MAEIDKEIQTLWAKYEDIAMHFNDLLMRLRTQSLAGIAAASTLVGVFAKVSVLDAPKDWLAATALFVAMGFFWVALACLDLFYYNRLLIGAVRAIIELETQSQTLAIKINMSTHIEREFGGNSYAHYASIVAFYVLVLIVIIAGAFFSLHMSRHSY